MLFFSKRELAEQRQFDTKRVQRVGLDFRCAKDLFCKKINKFFSFVFRFRDRFFLLFCRVRVAHNRQRWNESAMQRFVCLFVLVVVVFIPLKLLWRSLVPWLVCLRCKNVSTKRFCFEVANDPSILTGTKQNRD